MRYNNQNVLKQKEYAKSALKFYVSIIIGEKILIESMLYAY